ncbi:hypothetical protein A3K01_01905 [candidate division WWE3 bacterium RIFOXYD1_FULL_43_17]|uniref:Uncharacterized protein n=3 Tax=Katanobacteria TaxID=422282 RepID=A0A1F4XBG2_UNCKA|nr:MAG: ATP-dependent DNA helicase RecG [candidate division WWE3 bacterium GW2011_GWE1_41_27]KKS60336.1 MAG: ATP-dependent DNA helicase RecG [candidate division WWE3 bacterium GW2011_GWF2_42_42]OGC79045.1 MAG: hypothetical protein A3K01_01905 [candidate division WWE3 bacterium RIFOXYD1_FULL_43_17]
MKLTSPVGVVPKIGPKYKKLLENLEIGTVQDLLYHFPFRYEDYSNVKNISALLENETATIKGVVESVTNIFTRNGKRLTKVAVSSGTEKIDLIFFNQHYLKTTIKTGREYTVSGKVGTFDRKLSFISPELEESREVNLNTGRLVPVYPETYGVSSKWLRARINDVVLGGIELEEFLPENTIKKHDLSTFDWSLKQIHFPDTEINAEKSRKRFRFEELFLELLKVEKRRVQWQSTLKSTGMAIKDTQIDAFISSLPFKLTNSQEKSVNEILEDLTKKHPMNRLLEGDVGTGKTLVALIAAYNTHLNGFKTLYMAPTEILAAQLYETFTRLLSPFGVKIDLITGSTKPDGADFDILIGTHALIYSKEKFKNVELVVIDEQHRFGVEQRGKILEIANDGTVPHLLAMTATPIPRTLALTIYGDLSISVLDTHPNKERKISTKVIPENARDKAYRWIRQKNEPTFIVCPLIEESETLSFENVKAAEAEYASLKKTYFKDVEMGLLHGKMKPKEKEEVVEKFRKGKIKVLVSTPVIEVGIDVPEATVMVIESAERYGLASLHQLRGRVGRGSKEGFCLTFLSTHSPGAYSRLKNLENIDNGMELAEIDMRVRGQGDIFGAIQHGFKKFKIADMFNVKMLEEAKDEAKEIYPFLDYYPLLKERLTQEAGEYIPNN